MRFLCLHGMGVSSEIFKMQTAALRNELAGDHSYEFVQGHIECTMAPELEHISDVTKPHFAYHNNSPQSAIDALKDLDAYLTSESAFDGILAFSQGAGLALMYSRYFMNLRPGRPLPFRCLLLFSPVGLLDPVTWIETGKLRLLVDTASPLNIPIAVITGKHDLPQAISQTEDIHRMVQSDMGCWKYVHLGGHDIPNGKAKNDMRGTVRALRRAIAQADMMKRS
ncbi:unnamed protein product [Periconia digitata]|uniref:Serine hydrolase domain-containing protein n=1 Tax=Periconia digitata TaxID=1303443 RepID=A0A9W4UQB6_9PLEO|nr:unnamed protein product [Periconia digitata]